MATLTIPNTITAATEITAAPHAANYAAIEAHVNAELVNRDGSIAMTGELQLVDGNNAASTVQVDAAVAAAVPTGVMSMYGGASAPTGYLLCQGQEISRTTYAALFAVLGTAFGSGNGSTTFNIPDLRGRFPVGLEAGQAIWDALGETGGARDAVVVSHTHTDTFAVDSDGAHTHAAGTLATASDGAHTHDYDTREDSVASGSSGPPMISSGATINSNRTTDSAGAHTHTITGSTASDGAHTHPLSGSVDTAGVSGTDANLPPFLTVNYIIKT